MHPITTQTALLIQKVILIKINKIKEQAMTNT